MHAYNWWVEESKWAVWLSLTIIGVHNGFLGGYNIIVKGIHNNYYALCIYDREAH